MVLRVTVPSWARQLASDLTDMARAPRPVTPGETLELELPDDVYFEYGFIGEDGAVRPDPAGRCRARRRRTKGRPRRSRQIQGRA
jgi:hypothetical protein